MKLTPKQKVIAGAIGTVAIAGVIYTSVISPANSKTSSANAQLTSVQGAIAGDQTQLNQLEALASHQPALLASAFRLAKAVPVGPQTPGLILELQHLANASDVQLTNVRTISTQSYGNITATLYEVDVTGLFFNVDDFMYRVHNQVVVSESGKVAVKGRLFAVTNVQISLSSGSGSGTGATSKNSVLGALQMMAFSTGGSGATGSADGSTGATGASGSTGATGSTGASGSTGTSTSGTTGSGGPG